MKKLIAIIFAISLIAHSPALAAHPSVALMNNNWTEQIQSAELEYANALKVWETVDQVKYNIKPYSSPCNSDLCFGVEVDRSRYGLLMREFINFDSCWIVNTFACPRENIYHFKKLNNSNFTWDFENYYGIKNNSFTNVRLIAFRSSQLVPVKDDGTVVSLIEFEQIRSNLQQKYQKILTIKTSYSNAVADYQNARTTMFELNSTLKLNFPSTVKKDLIKEGYFKPLKPFYYTAKTGKYIVSATQITEDTFVIKSGPEYKRYKYTYTKKEQAKWIKEGQKKLDEAVFRYNEAVETAKINGYTVSCLKDMPCVVSMD